MFLLSIEQWITTVLVRSLGWTFAHSIWQALFALIAAYMILGLMKNAKPAARYNFLAATFIVFIFGVIVTFFYELQIHWAADAGLTDGLTTQPIFHSGNYAAAPVIVESIRIIDVLLHYFNQYLDVFVTLWFIIFSIRLLKLSLSLDYINRISKFECAAAKDRWQTLLNELKDKIGITKHVALMHSHIVKVPLVSGFLKPVILVPAGMLCNMPADVIESIFLHELAHIRRSDYLVNIVQSAFDIVFFFNPFILKLSALIREEREACCDTIAVQTTNNKISYVEALVSFGEYSTAASLTAFTASKNHLLQRARRILYNQNKKPGFMEKTILFSSVMILAMITAFTTIKNETRPASQLIHQIKNIITDTIPEGVQDDQPTAAPANRKADKKLRKAEQKLQMKQKELEEMQMKLETIQKKSETDMKLNNQHFEDEWKHLQEIKLDKKELEELQQSSAAAADRIKSIDLEKIKKEVDAVVNSKDIQKRITLATESLEELTKQQSEIDAITKKLSVTINNRFMNDDIAGILDFLEKNNVADAKDVKAFTLNDEELTVNGKKQLSSLHRQLKEKFLDAKGDHIIYSNSGGSKSITIKRNDPS
ncbi:MAG TPA: M56 family metallopeptidase [Flavitalea sp.]|nr:M56 family metallopeptidase [Flavitalea sp.]